MSSVASYHVVVLESIAASDGADATNSRVTATVVPATPRPSVRETVQQWVENRRHTGGAFVTRDFLVQVGKVEGLRRKGHRRWVCGISTPSKVAGQFLRYPSRDLRLVPGPSRFRGRLVWRVRVSEAGKGINLVIARGNYDLIHSEVRYHNRVRGSVASTYDRIGAPASIRLPRMCAGAR